MVRFGAAALIAIALAGCATGALQVDQLASGGPSLSLNDNATPAPGMSRRSGLGLSEPNSKPPALPGDVAVESSQKAPKGALDDRDYTGAVLNPEVALKLINDYRASQGLKGLRLDPRLTIAAKVQSRDLAKTDRISHYGADGSSPWDRVKRAGYSAKIAAENIGTGQATLEEVFKGWTQSPGHNRNLLLPGAHDMGIALVADPKTEFKTFWTLVVASSQ